MQLKEKVAIVIGGGSQTMWPQPPCFWHRRRRALSRALMCGLTAVDCLAGLAMVRALVMVNLGLAPFCWTGAVANVH